MHRYVSSLNIFMGSDTGVSDVVLELTIICDYEDH